MKNINKIIRMASVGAALAVVFTIAFATPVSAQAYGYSRQSYYVSNSGYNYGYNYSTPVTYPVYYPVYYQQPVVIQPQPVPVYTPVATPVYTPVYTYNPLTVSCYATPTSVSTGQNVTWRAYASGGSGIYDYTWSGTNSTYSSDSTAYSTYYSPGSYTASVTVYSNGQSVTQSCGYVSVVGSYAYNYTPTYAYNYPTTTIVPTTVVATQNTSGNLVAACFADKTTAQVGTPVTWAVEVTGGTGQYTYDWSGSDGLAGTGSSAVQAYSTAGQKNATVLITSGGQTLSQACGDSVSIKSYVAPAETNYQGPPTTAAPASSAAPANTANPNSLSAAALLGLGAIPWGWIAILIIIILGVTVFYLLFNRHKV